MANLRVLVPDSTTNYVKNPSFRHNTDGWQAISTPWGDLYWLYDEFTTDRAAGSVNGTLAEPVGGARTVTDTNTKISIAGGVLSSATGHAVGDNVSYVNQSRVLGRAVLGIVTPSTTDGTPQAGITVIDRFQFGGSAVLNVVVDNVATAIGTYAAATSYQVAIIARVSGLFAFIKGGAFTNWTFLWLGLGGTGDLTPIIRLGGTISVFTADNIRVPKRLFIPVPLQSDGFSAATTDGAGNAEANGAVGTAYTNVGTWGVASGVRSCSVLSGADGKSYLACSSTNVILDVAVTRGAGVAGLVARYVDAENYLIAYHDGTNAKLDKVVAGVTTSLISAAKAYSAGAVLRLILDGTEARLFYNNAAVGTLATTPAAGSLNHGLYTTDILSNGNSFDNLIVWARGTEGQYGGLDAL